jgi:hypothetical protein
VMASWLWHALIYIGVHIKMLMITKCKDYGIVQWIACVNLFDTID